MSRVRSCKLLVVGAGSAGCATAAMFGRLLPKHSVVLLDAAKEHYYQPMFTLIGGGLKNFKQCVRPMNEAVPKNVTWVQDSVESFHPDKDCVRTAQGDEISYDFMVVAVGIRPNYDKIEGLKDALDCKGSGVCTIYSPVYVQKTFEELKVFKGGNMIFTQPSTPIKCAGAPQKIMHLAEEHLRKCNIRDKAEISFITGLPVLFSVKKYEEALKDLASQKSIHTVFEKDVKSINLGTKEVNVQSTKNTEEISKYKFDFLHVVPPHQTPYALRGNKELADSDGYLTVNKYTLQHDVFKNVFGIGDCANLPTSKTAAAIAAQTGVLYKNLKQVMEGNKSKLAEYDGYTSCPLVTGQRKCILAEFDYDRNPLETFPVDQGKERMLFYWMKAHVLPPVYWSMMLRGYWHGPALLRKILHLG
ncbi:sulfide:quinone oxidoreductase, mitochondrial isoform X1 [Schistocerca cancellata]|uniref:sulfide:quinone oxidoreductase, mitochondrial isoform X1 n=1 Tax=Schistocerca cancellata TaxID=274614 RepID=UPI002118F523|nr:sulfide:quinone oxidoreductase, mitochondrial isoform X1 [Schistocerca cancellata]